MAGILVVGTTALAESISIQFDGGAFKASGWNIPRTPPAKGWPSVFAVYTGGGDVPALLGSYSVDAGTLVFRPSFPLAPGLHYRAVVHLPNGSSPVEKIFEGPSRDVTPRARVERVYPSTDILPSNQLRLYIYFSDSMSRGEAGQHIHILDEKGKPVPGVFLPGEELWDASFRRLTMTFDPGRIKRGLALNQDMGPPIVEGKRYTLTIDREWPDAHGVRMLEGFRKSFRGGPADRNPPDPKQWKVTAPKASTSEPLLVAFPRPMNYPLLQRMLHVSGIHGMIDGAVSIGKLETEWRFTPREPWSAGAYQLVADTMLEDLAGNHIGQAFDIDVFEHVSERIATNTVSLPFVIH